MYIGLSNVANGSGILYVDDIRLHKAEFVLAKLPPWAPDILRDGVIDEGDLDVMCNNWLISGGWSVTPTAPAAGPVAWYQLEQNTNDSANGFDGDPCGAPTYSTEKKEGSYSIDLDGVDDYVNTDANATDLGIGGNAAKSVTAWAYTRSFNNGGIFDMGNYTAGQNFCLRTLTTNNRWRTQLYGGAYDMDFTYPSMDTWVHFALVHEPNVTTVYADGNLVVSGPRVLNTMDNTPFRIGNYNNGAGLFDGLVDDVQVYNYALTQDEVAYLAGRSAFTQPVWTLLTPPDPNINLYDKDETIDFKDFAELGNVWGDTQVWPTW
jgi:hypothetical protein